MSLVNINPEKCRRDGICVAECPMALLTQPEKDQPPVAMAGAEEICINCGHCLAVCPHGALELRAMPLDQTDPLDPALLPPAEQVDLALRARRSIRVYKDEPLTRQQLAELIDVARYSPSGYNRQPLHWLVISDPDHLRSIGQEVVEWMGHVIKQEPALAAQMHLERLVSRWRAGEDVVLRGAPHLVVTHAPEDESSAQAASTIALTFLDLGANSRGLGACWAGFVMRTASAWPPMIQALDLPQDHACFGAMLLGRPRFSYQRIPARNPARITWR